MLISYKLTYKPFGDSAILIEWPAKIDEKIIQDIVSFEIEAAQRPNVLDTIIAYNSLTIHYKESVHFDEEVLQLKITYDQKQETKQQVSRLWEIPVCYDQQFGLDLEEIASQKQLSVAQIIQLHTAPAYLIYFLGFQPGFMYLGGLDTQIHVPRKSNPRLRVAKGSVGIGGEQTGIYPQDSAGGWNLVGRSPINFFDISKLDPCFARAGDRVQFVAIDIEEFYRIEREVNEGMYQLKKSRL